MVIIIALPYAQDGGALRTQSHDSKYVLRRELNDARVGCGTCNPAEGSACRRIWERWITVAQECIGICKLWRIRQVEELYAEPEAAGLSHRKDPFDRQVQVVLPWSAHDTNAAIAKVLIGQTGSIGRLGG